MHASASGRSFYFAGRPVALSRLFVASGAFKCITIETAIADRPDGYCSDVDRSRSKFASSVFPFCPDATDIIAGYRRSSASSIETPFRSKNTSAAAKPTRLLPSTNGWFWHRWNAYAAANSYRSECGAEPSNVARGTAIAELTRPTSRTPNSPPYLEI